MKILTLRTYYDASLMSLVSGSPSEMVVSYLTIGKPDTVKVKYGLVSNQYTYKATGESVNYLKVNCSTLLEIFSKLCLVIKSLLISNLERRRRYRYVP